MILLSSGRTLNTQIRKEVKRILGESSGDLKLNPSSKKAGTPQDKHNSYTPKEMVQIGKYTTENSTTRLLVTSLSSLIEKITVRLR